MLPIDSPLQERHSLLLSVGIIYSGLGGLVYVVLDDVLLHTARIVILDDLIDTTHKVDILEEGNCTIGIEHELRTPLDLHAVGEHLVGLDTHRNFGDGIERMHLDAVTIL